MKKINCFNIIITLILFSASTFTQDCDAGYTYIENIPTNVTNINNDTFCFYNDDLQVLNEFILLNNLDDYNSEFELGIQTWVTSRLVSWVATYTIGQNGLTQKINQIPENIGLLTDLEYIYIEKHNITYIPDSFSQLTKLKYLGINNNYLQSIPNDFGNLINLETLDLGYNLIESLPETIGNLQNIEYLFLFNNKIHSVPTTICNLDLNWSGVSSSNYPYFAIGGNILCNSEYIPICVETSDNFEISLEPNYYSFMQQIPQDCCSEEIACNYNLDAENSDNCIYAEDGYSNNPIVCPNGNFACNVNECCPSLTGDINNDNLFNVLDIVTLANCVLSQNCINLSYGCSGDMNEDGLWNVLDIVTLANCVLSQNCSE